MSLLDTGNQPITIYPEEVVMDLDGNTITRPSKTGVPACASIQPQGASGTSARRAEQDNEGFETERMYRMRLPRRYIELIGAQAQIEWLGKRWAVHGDAMIYCNSPRTGHYTYTIRRF